MKIYIFGNQDLPEDSAAFKAAKYLEKDSNKTLQNLQFVTVYPNQDLPFENQEKVILMDTVEGIDKVTVIKDRDLEKLITSPRTSVHDFDLGFQLKYLKKLGKLGEVIIIGLPIKSQNKTADYKEIHSILRKLVAQDIQGS
jgi:Ni,Fe-hydrogenase maturation factor